MIRKATLDESMDAQRDHARRCKEMVDKGIVANSPDNERESYTDATNMIPELFRGLQDVHVLDVGCQTLEAYPYLYEVVGDGIIYHGLEILPELVEEMSQKYPDREIKQGYMEKMPYEDDSIDVVWARHVLEHSTDIDKVLQEIKRILSDRGVLIFTVPIGVHNEPAHFIEVEVPDWNAIFERNGFVLAKHGQHNYNLNEYYGLLLPD